MYTHSIKLNHILFLNFCFVTLSEFLSSFNKMLFQDLSDDGLPQNHFQLEDDDLAHAISLSLQVLEIFFLFLWLNLYCPNLSDS